MTNLIKLIIILSIIFGSILLISCVVYLFLLYAFTGFYHDDVVPRDYYFKDKQVLEKSVSNSNEKLDPIEEEDIV